MSTSNASMAGGEASAPARTTRSAAARRPLGAIAVPNDEASNASETVKRKEADRSTVAPEVTPMLEEHQVPRIDTDKMEAQSATEPVASTSTVASSNQDANDFLARAKALGLNLTLQDYERARAGVSAFLRAERVNAGQDTPATSSTTLASKQGAPSEMKQAPQRRIVTSTRPLQPAYSGTGTANDAVKRSTNAGSRLSFFTAIVPSTSPEKDSKASRPSLDDISSLIERRRRREKRRRLRERAERAGSEADCELGSRLRKARTSSASTLVPIASLSPAIGSQDAKGEDGTSTGVASLPPAQASEGASSPRMALRRVFSASALDMPVDFGSQARKVPTALRTPVRLVHALNCTPSPTLTRLNRRVYIDDDGLLQLHGSPRAATALQRCSNNGAGLGAAADTHPDVASGGYRHDTDLAPYGSNIEHNSKAQHVSRSPHSHRRRTSSADSSLFQAGSNDEMGFLDRIMAQKRSPRRLRREARAREQQARIAQNQVVVMAATAVPDAAEAALAAAMPPPPPVHRDLQADATGATANAASLEGKNVHWANDFGSPRKRMTTKEIYDLDFYGTSPGVQHGHHASGSLGGWEHLASYTNGQVMHLPGSASKSRHLSFGSPHSSRHRSTPSVEFSPRGLLIGDHDRAPGSHTLRRGLLFGNGVGDGAHAQSASSLDGALGDMSSIFSHGPTLACSPARKSLDAGETPPRIGLVRANTLATPFMYSQVHTADHGLHGGLARAFGSPDRATLLRSHSTGQIRRAHSRKTSLLSLSYTHDTDKENVATDFPHDNLVHAAVHEVQSSSRLPNGWAHRSPLGKAYPTVSPLAVFGLQGQNHVFAPPLQQSMLGAQSGMLAATEDARDKQIKLQAPERAAGGDARQQRQHARQIASDNEGDDERDGSPVKRGAGRSRAPKRSVQHAALSWSKDAIHARESSQSDHSARGDSPSGNDDRPVAPRHGFDSRTQLTKAPVREQKSGHMPNHDQQARRQQEEQMALSSFVPEEMPQHAAMSQAHAPVQATFDGYVPQLDMQMEFLQPDGSRLVRLVSEELEQALKSGSLIDDPPPRFYRLPPNSGISSSKPQSSSYAGMIGQAILSSSDGRLSLNEIYNWIATVYPFFERGDRGWQNSIRHNLSLNKSFMKVEREAHNPGKGGLWAIKPGHEMCFRAGNYFAPGSAKSVANAREASHAFARTPKTPHNGLLLAHAQHAAAFLDGMTGVDLSAQTRRKRRTSERSLTTEQAGGADRQEGRKSGARTSSKTKRARGNAGKRQSSPQNGSPAQVESQHTVMSQPHGQPFPMDPIAMMEAEGMQPYQGMPMYSPHEYDTITPSRPYEPRHMGTNSSEFGSAYASSIMASMPMLTDASSPPSSPQTVMPPPAGGIHGAASTKSAQKRRGKSAQLRGAKHNVFGGSSNAGPPGSALPWSQGMPANMFAMPPNMHSSPLANLRAQNVMLSSNPMKPASTLGKYSHAVAGPYVATGSPTRRSTASPSRLLMQSPPVSSLRNTAPEHRSRHVKTGSFGRSPTRMRPSHSPVRGSPLRPGGPLNQAAQNGQMSMASPAGMSMQMALTGHPGAAYQNVASFLNFSGPEGEQSSSGLTPLAQRSSYASPSPSRRLHSTTFSPAFSTPNVHLHGPSGTHSAAAPSSLDDPFGYSDNLQHELDFTSMTTDDVKHHRLGSSFGDIDPSPLKGLYMQPHLYGIVPGAAFSAYDSPTKAGTGTRTSSSMPHSLHGAI